MDIDIKVLLKEMVDADGSDLFLTCDAAPSMKAFGKMVPMREERFAPGDVKRIAYSIMNEEQRALFDKSPECNLAIMPQRRKEEEHGDSPQHPLRDHESRGEEAQAPDPSRLPAPPEPDREDEHQEAHRGGDHPVAVLEEDSPHHRGVQRAVGEGPVRDGEPGARARH